MKALTEITREAAQELFLFPEAWHMQLKEEAYVAALPESSETEILKTSGWMYLIVLAAQGPFQAVEICREIRKHTKQSTMGEPTWREVLYLGRMRESRSALGMSFGEQLSEEFQFYRSEPTRCRAQHFGIPHLLKRFRAVRELYIDK